MGNITADLQGKTEVTDKEIDEKLRLIQADFTNRLSEYRVAGERVVARFEAAMDKFERLMEVAADKQENAREKLRNEMILAHNELAKKVDERGGKTFQYVAITISMIVAVLSIALFFVQHIHFN